MGFWADLFKSKDQIAKEKKEALIRESIAHKKQLNARLSREARSLERKSHSALNSRKKSLPVVAAKNKLESTLRMFASERRRLNLAWDKAYANFSWWNKLKYGGKLDLRKLDKQIEDVEYALRRFESVYSDDIGKVEEHFRKLETVSKQRIEAALNRLKTLVEEDKLNSVSSTSVAAVWIAGLSVPVSIAGDLYASDQVFNALRGVNGNFESMSNSEIWWETLWMSPESLVGLASLTKGAYFEQLVATDTGGQLFENFNHADTDITIDGIEFQLKASDSINYINSVDDEIPVITTSEVAAQTSSIDSGYSDAELTNTVDLAIGGTVVDAQDTAVDAILAGVGSLGFFATIQGINHAQAQYDKGVKGEEAVFEGLGVAIEGTARGIVDASEMAYNVATSSPMRFIGRGLLKGITKLDEKMMQSADTERRK